VTWRYERSSGRQYTFQAVRHDEVALFRVESTADRGLMAGKPDPHQMTQHPGNQGVDQSVVKVPMSFEEASNVRLSLLSNH